MGKKTKIVMLFLIPCLLFIIGSKSAFAYFEFADGRIYLTGWAENITALRLQNGVNDKWDLNMCRNTLQLEATVKLTSNINFFCIARGYYEAKWDLDSGLDERQGFPFLPELRPEHRYGAPKGAPMKDDFDLREWYFTIRCQDFTFKIGRQQVIWGEADALRMADIINPLDLSWHWVHETWEDLRIPLRMVNIMYEPTSEHQLRFQLVWVPEDFRPQSFSAEGTTWSPASDLPYGLGGLPYGALQLIWDQQRFERPNQHHELENGEIGGRIQAVFGGWEFSIFDYYARVDTAVNQIDFSHFHGLNSTQPLPMDFDWPRVNIVGGTFNVFDLRTRTVFRGEMAYTIDQPYSAFNYSRIIERDTIAFMLGFDRPTIWHWLNPRKSFFISGQWFHKHILNFDKDIQSPETDRDRYWNIVSLLINTSYWYDYITPQMLIVYDFSGNGFWTPTIKYEPNDTWTLTFGALFIYGQDNTDGYWGPVRKNDEIFLRLRMKF